MPRTFLSHSYQSVAVIYNKLIRCRLKLFRCLAALCKLLLLINQVGQCCGVKLVIPGNPCIGRRLKQRLEIIEHLIHTVRNLSIER